MRFFMHIFFKWAPKITISELSSLKLHEIFLCIQFLDLFIESAQGHSLSPDKCNIVSHRRKGVVLWGWGFGFKYVIFTCVEESTFMKSYDVFWWMARDPTDHKSTLVQIMAGCCQATSNCRNQWLRSFTPYGIIRPQWVKSIFVLNTYNNMNCVYIYICLVWVEFFCWCSISTLVVAVMYKYRVILDPDKKQPDCTCIYVIDLALCWIQWNFDVTWSSWIII